MQIHNSAFNHPTILQDDFSPSLANTTSLLDRISEIFENIHPFLSISDIQKVINISNKIKNETFSEIKNSIKKEILNKYQFKIKYLNILYPECKLEIQKIFEEIYSEAKKELEIANNLIQLQSIVCTADERLTEEARLRATSFHQGNPQKCLKFLDAVVEAEKEIKNKIQEDHSALIKERISHAKNWFQSTKF